MEDGAKAPEPLFGAPADDEKTLEEIIAAGPLQGAGGAAVLPLPLPLPTMSQTVEEPTLPPMQDPTPKAKSEDMSKRLEFLLAMFKTRNIDLVQENNALRLENEQLRQQAAMKDGGGSILADILGAVAADSAEEEKPQKKGGIFSRRSGRGRGKTPRRQKALEFLSELDNLPRLPEFKVQTAEDGADSAPTASSGGSSSSKPELPDDIVPCIYMQ